MCSQNLRAPCRKPLGWVPMLIRGLCKACSQDLNLFGNGHANAWKQLYVEGGTALLQCAVDSNKKLDCLKFKWNFVKFNKTTLLIFAGWNELGVYSFLCWNLPSGIPSSGQLKSHSFENLPTPNANVDCLPSRNRNDRKSKNEKMKETADF